jgi:hypothetical protein
LKCTQAVSSVAITINGGIIHDGNSGRSGVDSGAGDAVGDGVVGVGVAR